MAKPPPIPTIQHANALLAQLEIIIKMMQKIHPIYKMVHKIEHVVTFGPFFLLSQPPFFLIPSTNIAVIDFVFVFSAMS